MGFVADNVVLGSSFIGVFGFPLPILNTQNDLFSSCTIRDWYKEPFTASVPKDFEWTQSYPTLRLKKAACTEGHTTSSSSSKNYASAKTAPVRKNCRLISVYEVEEWTLHAYLTLKLYFPSHIEIVS